jgi:hypothetical protein
MFLLPPPRLLLLLLLLRQRRNCMSATNTHAPAAAVANAAETGATLPARTHTCACAAICRLQLQ